MNDNMTNIHPGAKIGRNVVISPFTTIAEHVEIREGDPVIRGENQYLCPGFVDIHVHGGGGFSAMSGKL